MVQHLIYKYEATIPQGIKQQILDFLRIVWKDGFRGDNHLRDWISKEEYHPVFFVFVEKNMLISHVAVVWKHIMHKGQTYKMYALSGMFTYPQFRKQGYGLKLAKKAVEYMRKQDGDMILVHSCLRGFYEKAGLKPLPEVITLVGNPQKPKKDNQSAFGMFLSERGKQGRKYFESEPFYFGDSLW